MPLANTINRYDEMFTSLIYILITDNDDTKTTLKISQTVSKLKKGNRELYKILYEQFKRNIYTHVKLNFET